MKKTLSIILVTVMILAFGVEAAASSEESSGEITLDTVIPADVEERITAAVYLDGVSGQQNAAGVTYTVTANDQSGIYAKNGSVYTLTGATFTKPAGILSSATSYNKDTVTGPAGSRVCFHLVAEADRMGE